MFAPFVVALVLPGHPADLLSPFQTYQRPSPPFQPLSDFGREHEAATQQVFLRARLSDAVHIERYCGAYETSPTQAQLDYERGVDEAERAADAAAGGPAPLRAPRPAC
ncbi:hypothetical protein E4M02_03425 [Brevundimonas sp. S30B]|uniref:hypothetical protein n=1 Tax=Brevundimonas sp. MF30-B TaxID=2561924 RepID=UPI0010762F45|nr:hypothetical protein [Brevundimonas sp. MF30-B]QBX37068.1 hypothetical protein E4M01_04390 [Brevundimonas sp. MF30-B]TFW04136.1 hypothetical protein E4M02_03425 [Brevundimonas sp. S30B]